MKYPHLAARLFNTPLLIHPGKLSAIVAGLSSRFDLMPAPSAYATPAGTREKGGYRALDNGIAIIDIFGALAHHGSFQADSSYIEGYNTIAHALDSALKDGHVRAILLNIDSPGGEVAGAFQLAEQIHAARGVKPIAAVASDLACSAAYLLASAADSISVTRTGIVGSIGVTTCHADLSRQLDKAGIAITCIYAGAHKVDGNPYQPLPPEVAAQIQADVDHYYELFLNTVATYRRQTDVQALRATEARTYIGPQAVSARLADRIETPDQAIARLAASLSSSSPSRLSAKRSQSMTDETTVPELPETPTPDPIPEPAALNGPTIAALCNRANLALLAPALLSAPHTEAQVNARLERATAVRQICAAARQPDKADALILADADETTAKAACWDALIARSEASPVDNTPPAPLPDHLPLDERCAAEWQRNPALRAEFGELAIYTAYTRAHTDGKAKTYGGTA